MTIQPTIQLDPLGPPDNFPTTGTCRFTSDDPSEPGLRMCGRNGEPWCEFHRALVFAGKKQGS